MTEQLKKVYKRIKVGDKVKYRSYDAKWLNGQVVQSSEKNTREYEVMNEQRKGFTRNRIYVFAKPTKELIEDKNEDEMRLNENVIQEQAKKEEEIIPKIMNDRYVTRYGRVVRPVNRLTYNK